MSKLIQFSMGSTLILPSKNAAKILELLEEAWELKSEWSNTDISISKSQSFSFSAFSEDKFRDITKAQIAGMTYGEYLDAQRESKSSLQKNKNIFE